MLFNLMKSDPKQVLADMVKAYRSQILPVITKELQKKYPPSEKRPVVEQTQCVWFSKEEVLEFLSKNPESNGIRIYFAAHNGSTLSKDGHHKEYQGQLTLVLVPTHKGKKGEDDMNSPDMQEGTALDHGSLCPTDCPRTGGPTMLFP